MLYDFCIDWIARPFHLYVAKPVKILSILFKKGICKVCGYMFCSLSATLLMVLFAIMMWKNPWAYFSSEFHPLLFMVAIGLSGAVAVLFFIKMIELTCGYGRKDLIKAEIAILKEEAEAKKEEKNRRLQEEKNRIRSRSEILDL